MTNVFAARRPYRSCVAGLLAGGIGLIDITHAASQQTCKPTLALKDVKYSKMQPPTLKRKWTAIVLVDASRCETTVGSFAVSFSRSKENGPDIDSQERFIWSSPAAEVRINFWADEAVESYRISNVDPCPCAR